MIKQIIPNVFSINIILPGSPLKNLNSYVIKSSQRSLIIDTGFNMPECYDALYDGIKELGICMDETDIFVTHLHADHSGLVPAIAGNGTKVYMSTADSDILSRALNSDMYMEKNDEIYLSEGFPGDELIKLRDLNPAIKLAPKQRIDFTPINDGDVICVGDTELICVSTPGHSPGHVCLYNDKHKAMFLGDHVLFDITPNITTWMEMPDSLAIYMESLDKIRNYNVDLPLPAHRGNSGLTMEERVDQLFEHHRNRLSDTLNTVLVNPGIDGYNVASKLKWSIRARSWAEFPLAQKWFAFGEALAHLYYLVMNGRLKKDNIKGVFRYYTC